MREVLVPIGFTAHSWRRPAVLIAAWLVVLQAFLTGVATAQAGAMLAADPFGVAVICHGGGGTDPAEPAAPDTGTAWHLCCTYCMSAAPALPPPVAPGIAQALGQNVAAPSELARFTVIAARGAVRAGSSQAPPSQA
jgi:hypothetical protein